MRHAVLRVREDARITYFAIAIRDSFLLEVSGRKEVSTNEIRRVVKSRFKIGEFGKLLRRSLGKLLSVELSSMKNNHEASDELNIIVFMFAYADITFIRVFVLFEFDVLFLLDY